MYGTMIVDPAGGRPAAHEFVLCCAVGTPDGDGRNEFLRMERSRRLLPEVPFEGAVGELVRLYLVNMVEYDPVASFHLHAQTFDLYRSGTSATPHEHTDVVNARADRARHHRVSPAAPRAVHVSSAPVAHGRPRRDGLDRGDLTMPARCRGPLNIAVLLAACQIMKIADSDNFASGWRNEARGVLIDQYGHPMPASKLSGHYLLVYFGYTSCPDICRAALATISRTLDLIGPQSENVLPLFVTVDPARDTVAVMRGYVAHFNRRLIGLTGSPGAIAAARKAFDVTAKQRPSR
jgi:protein SCO1/2